MHKRLSKFIVIQNNCMHKTYLVTSNGELFIAWNIVRNSSLWNNVVMGKEARSHKFVQQGCCFFPLISCNFDVQLSQNIYSFVILCICWGIMRILVFDIYQKQNNGQNMVSKTFVVAMFVLHFQKSPIYVCTCTYLQNPF